jgi:hypothetical protein
LLANLNSWLAAQRLKLPKCSKLIPIGDLISIQQCAVVNTTFETVVTHCGPQLKTGNSTLSATGFELVPYSVCASTNNQRFIGGVAYQYDGVQWKEMGAHIISPHQHLLHAFQYTDEIGFTISPYHHGKVTFPDDILQNMQTLMSERGGDPSPLPISEFWWNLTSNFPSSPWHQVKFYGLIILIIIVCLLTCKLLHCCGVFGMLFDWFVFWCCCCYKNHSPVSQQDDLLKMTMYPRINSTAFSMHTFFSFFFSIIFIYHYYCYFNFEVLGNY